MTLDKDALDAAIAKIPAGEPGDMIDVNRRIIGETAITTYLTEIGKTHVLVPRELDRKMLTVADRSQGHLSKYGIKILWSAIVAEIDAREKFDG